MAVFQRASYPAEPACDREIVARQNMQISDSHVDGTTVAIQRPREPLPQLGRPRQLERRYNVEIDKSGEERDMSRSRSFPKALRLAVK